METFSLVKRGYNPEEVDSYIATLEQVIKSYKDKDNAIKNAIISAQVAADNVIQNAHLQAAEYKQKIARQLQIVQESIQAQRNRLNAFQVEYNSLMRKYFSEVNDMDLATLHNRLDEVSQMVDNLSKMDELNSDTETQF